MARNKLYIRGKDSTLRQFDVAISTLVGTSNELCREFVGKVFRRVLNQTPQFSGEAVASWTIGINAPAPLPVLSAKQQTGMGDKRIRRLAGEMRPLKKGSDHWIGIAWQRESPKLQKLKRKDKVYITNRVLGESGELYMELMQNPDYWMKRLRDVNKPYEVVGDSVAHIMAQYLNKRVDAFKVYIPEYGGEP